MYRQRVALDPILERQRHGGQKAQLGKDAPPGDKLRRLVDRCPDDVERRTAKLVGAWKRRGLDPQPPRDAARLGGDVFSIMCSCAVRARLAPVLELLLDEEDGLDADPNLATPSGLTPLHLAAEYDNFAAVACLIRHGADPEMREHAFDRQPLHMAASYAAPATVMLLVVETGRAVEAALLEKGVHVDAARAAAARVLDDASSQGTPCELARNRLPDRESRRVRKVLVTGAWDNAWFDGVERDPGGCTEVVRGLLRGDEGEDDEEPVVEIPLARSVTMDARVCNKENDHSPPGLARAVTMPLEAVELPELVGRGPPVAQDDEALMPPAANDDDDPPAHDPAVVEDAPMPPADDDAAAPPPRAPAVVTPARQRRPPPELYAVPPAPTPKKRSKRRAPAPLPPPPRRRRRSTGGTYTSADFARVVSEEYARRVTGAPATPRKPPRARQVTPDKAHKVTPPRRPAPPVEDEEAPPPPRRRPVVPVEQEDDEAPPPPRRGPPAPVEEKEAPAPFASLEEDDDAPLVAPPEDEEQNEAPPPPPPRRRPRTEPPVEPEAPATPRRPQPPLATPPAPPRTTEPTLRPRPAGPNAQPETLYRRLPRPERLRRSAERRHRRGLAARAALQQRSHPMALRRRTVQLRQDYMRLFTEWCRIHTGEQEVL